MAVVEMERSFIVERNQAGQEGYRAASAAGPAAFRAYLARRGGHSHSGKNLPNGRPQRAFPARRGARAARVRHELAQNREETGRAAVHHPRRLETLKNPRSEEHTSELQSLRHLVCR